MKAIGGKVILLGASCIVALLLAEVLLRFAPAGSRIALESAPRRVSEMGQLLQRDPDPRILFRLKSNLDTTFLGCRVTTGSLGFRGGDPSDAGTTVVALGDSVAFGWGVADDETYISLMGKELRRHDPTASVVNLGVPGYNTIQEVALFERHIETLRPKWVTIVFNGNDFRPSGDFQRLHFLDLHSYLYRLISLRVRGIQSRRSVDAGHVAVHDALRHLGELSRQHHFRVIFFIYAGFVDDGPALPKETKAQIKGKSYIYAAGVSPHAHTRTVCEEQGFVVRDLATVLESARQRGLIDSFPDIWLRSEEPVDPHPSTLGHSLIAEDLLSVIEGGGAAETPSSEGPRR